MLKEGKGESRRRSADGQQALIRGRGALPWASEKEGQPGEGRQSVTESFIPKMGAVRAPGCAAVPETESSKRRFPTQKISESLCLRDHYQSSGLGALIRVQNLGDPHQSSGLGDPHQSS